MTTIPVFSTLYKINNNNKIYEWNIKIVKKDAIYTMVTSHGEQNGKKIVHERDIEEGKAKKTVLEQAIQEAKRKWLNKKDKELYSETVPIIDSIVETKSIVVRPMLAQKFNIEAYSKKSRAFKIAFPAYIQRKYDGIRCIAYMKNNELIIESRTGTPFQNFNLLKSQLKELFKTLPENFYFDGELYTDKLNFEVIAGLIHLHEKTITEEDIKNIDLMDYYIYDFIDLNNLELKYFERLDFLTNFFKKVNKKITNVKTVETLLVNSVDDIQTYHDIFVNEGFEGIMIRDKEGKYEVDKRSKYLQKYKEFFEDEFKIINFSEDIHGKVLWHVITKFNVEAKVPPICTHEDAKKMFKEGAKYIGKLLTVKYFGYTEAGSLRMPKGKAIRDNY